MQSSLGGVVRALVMLACLILVPLMALPDISVPEWIKRLSDGRWNGTWGRKATSVGESPMISHAAAAKSPPQRDGISSGSLFGGLPASLNQAGTGGPSSTPSSGTPSSMASQFSACKQSGAFCRSSQPILPGSSAMAVTSSRGGPLGGDSPMATESSRRVGTTVACEPAARSPQGDAPRSSGLALSRAQGIIPTAFVEQSQPHRDASADGSGLGGDRRPMRQEAAAQPAVRATASQSFPTPSPEQLARFRVVEERLRKLGAAHYLLEVWGSAAEYYRFRCRMPVASGSVAVRHFEATDSDGLAAMSKVLAEIEAWKAESL